MVESSKTSYRGSFQNTIPEISEQWLSYEVNSTIGNLGPVSIFLTNTFIRFVRIDCLLVRNERKLSFNIQTQGVAQMPTLEYIDVMDLL